MNRRYRIFGARYELSEKLMENPSYAPAGENSIVKWPEEITAVPKVFHIEITEDKKRIAFLTRNTYEEAKHIAEDYCSYGTKTV